MQYFSLCVTADKFAWTASRKSEQANNMQEEENFGKDMSPFEIASAYTSKFPKYPDCVHLITWVTARVRYNESCISMQANWHQDTCIHAVFNYRVIKAVNVWLNTVQTRISTLGITGWRTEGWPAVWWR